MSNQRKPTGSEELERIEEALVENLLAADADALRAEFAAAGLDPDACVRDVEAAISAGRSDYARERLGRARAEMEAWRGGPPVASEDERGAARERVRRLQSGIADDGMMMAARKGEKLADETLEDVAEDLAELDRLEREEGDE